MRFSIITVALNASGTIGDTIISVRSQIGETFEHIIVDGGSRDGTRDVVETLKHDNLKCLYGPDDGLYDAMNKGIDAATGEIIAFLNADDFYCRDDVFRLVSDEFDRGNVDAVCGGVSIIRPNGDGKLLRYYDAAGFKPWMVRIGHMPPHPGFFANRATFDVVGGFDKSLRTAADFDWMVRFFLIHNRSASMLSEAVTTMRFGGQSQNIKGVNQARRESIESLRRHGFAFPRVSIWLKYFLKLSSFLPKRSGEDYAARQLAKLRSAPRGRG